MLKKVFLVSFVFTTCKIDLAKAQVYKINYEVNHITDTVLKRNLRYISLLFTNKNKTYYTSENKITNDSIMKNWETDFLNGKLGNDLVAPQIKHLSSHEMIEIYKEIDDIKNFREVRTIPTGTSHLIIDSLIDIKWTLFEETKKILNYNCQKASCNFKGRVWYAWFTKEIPINSGPWKLWNLPGLILQANSEDETISFYAFGIDNFKADENIFFIPKTIKLSSKANYYKHLKAYANDPDAYFNTIHNVSKGDVIFSTELSPTPKLRISNNPIEVYE